MIQPDASPDDGGEAVHSSLPPAEQITQPSHDDEGLIERLNGEAELIEAGMNFDDGDTIDALRQAANTISRLKGELEGLHLAICGGEDAPGYAASLSHETILRVLAENYASAKRDADLAWDGETATSWKSRSLLLAAALREIADDATAYSEGRNVTDEMIVNGDLIIKARSLLSPAQEGLSSARASRDARSST